MSQLQNSEIRWTPEGLWFRGTVVYDVHHMGTASILRHTRLRRSRDVVRSVRTICPCLGVWHTFSLTPGLWDWGFPSLLPLGGGAVGARLVLLLCRDLTYSSFSCWDSDGLFCPLTAPWTSGPPAAREQRWPQTQISGPGCYFLKSV